MISLTPLELQILARLGRSPDGPLLRGILERMRQDADADCRTKEGAALFRAQGAAQRLDEVIQLLSGAAEKKLDATQNRRIVPAGNWHGPERHTPEPIA